MEWRIYYDDGHRLDGDADTVIPHGRRDGVLVVVSRNAEMEWEVMHSANYYALTHEGYWLYLDDAGMVYHVLHKLDTLQYVLQGAMTQYERYRSILEQAHRDMRPPKTAWRKGEKF